MRWTAIALYAALAISLGAASEPALPPLSAANAALQAGQADKALGLLHSLSASEAGSAEASNLICRVFFTLEDWDSAAMACSQAVNLNPQNGAYHLWLGRALGQRAEQASFLSAYGLAKRACAEFEKAAQLDPHNPEVLADLGEFYKSAPSVVGGGVSKAEAVATQLDHLDPVRAHELRGFIAEAKRDDGTAEREFKQALAVSKHPAFQWVRLASFYRRLKRWDDMESAVKNTFAAAQRDNTAGVALFNDASVLIKSNRDPDLAIKLLEAYLAASSQTEEAPVFVAHVWLARLRAHNGDLAGAHRDRAIALALASQYKPAQDLKI